jgi:hypothetical protein
MRRLRAVRGSPCGEARIRVRGSCVRVCRDACAGAVYAYAVTRAREREPVRGAVPD